METQIFSFWSLRRTPT